MRSRTPPSSPSRARDAAPRDSGPGTPEQTLETSRLLLELVHVVYATRVAEAETAAGIAGLPEGQVSRGPAVDGLHAGRPSGADPSASARAVSREAPSTHAIRAAIHVHQHGPRTVGQLAEGLGISYGWASRVVSELEAGGLVERHVDPSDRRVVHVSLTPEAAAMVERTYRWRGEAVQRALDGLDARQRAGVRAFLRSVTEELGRTGRDVPG